MRGERGSPSDEVEIFDNQKMSLHVTPKREAFQVSSDLEFKIRRYQRVGI